MEGYHFVLKFSVLNCNAEDTLLNICSFKLDFCEEDDIFSEYRSKG